MSTGDGGVLIDCRLAEIKDERGDAHARDAFGGGAKARAKPALRLDDSSFGFIASF